MTTLAQLQDRKKWLKKAKVVQVQIRCLLELKQHLLPLKMPATLSTLTIPLSSTSAVAAAAARQLSTSSSPFCRLVHIPMPDVYEVEGACLTGPMQMQWMGQLMKLPRQFVLHADSKFKLHHGDWVLTSLGTHHLRWDGHAGNLSTSFVPLMYLMTKQHESTGSALMLMDALNVTTIKYFGGKLVPGACMSDHCVAFRSAFEKTWPEAMFGTCWPHIIRKWCQGDYAKKTWAHFDEVTKHLQTIHLGGHTPQMRDLLMGEIGGIWDEWGTQMNKFWDSYCVIPWDCWTIGLFDCMLCTPSQQTQETWHKQLLLSKIPGMMRGSTENLFEVTLPQLIEMDAIQIPTELGFHVPAIPKGMIEKALWYVDHRETHVWIFKVGGSDDDFGYYFLRKSNKTGLKKITQRLLSMYEKAYRGEWDDRLQDVEHLGDICTSLHTVLDQEDKWPVPECELNPMKMDCMNCKGFKGVGICSHVLAVNHMMKKINLRREVMEIGQSSYRKNKAGNQAGGNRKKPLPALTRAPAREADSSDEEEQRLLEQGEEGR